MKHKKWSLTLVVLTFLCSCHGQMEKALSLMETTAVIFSLQQYFHSGCVFFLHSTFRVDYELRDEVMLLQLRKKLSLQNVATMALTIGTSRISLNSLKCQKNRPINVLTNSDQDTRLSIQEMSDKPGFSKAIWLLLFNTETTVNTFFSEIYVPMDSEVLVVQRPNDAVRLTEVYNVGQNYPLQLYDFGKWSPSTGLVTTEQPFCVRRGDFNGISIKAVSVTDHPYIVLTTLPNGTTTITGGFFGLVWIEFEKKLNFKTDFTVLENSLDGHLVNGSKTNAFTKMIDEVKLHKYDFAVAQFRFTKDRFDVVDYTYLMHRSKFVIALTPADSEDMAWNHFFGPFQPTLWLGLIGCILIIASCLSIFHYVGRILVDPEYENHKQYTFFISVFYVFSMFCQQGHDVTPKSCACRLVYWLGYVTAVVVLAAYSATLISFLTIQSKEPHVRTLEALAKDRTYKMGMLRKYLRIVRNNSDNGITDEIYDRMIAPDPKNIPSTSLEGLQRVCQMKYAFWTSVEAVKQVGDAVDCNIAFLPTYSYKFNLGYVVSENNPYLRFINFLINKMQAGGVLRKHKLDSWAAHVPENQNTWTSVSVGQVSPLLIILAGGVVASMIFLLLEMGACYWKKQPEQTHHLWSGQLSKQLPTDHLLFRV